MLELSYMKFVGSKDQKSSYQLKFQEVEMDAFPFFDILLQKDLTGIKYVEGEEILFENIFQLKVNVKKVGSVFFFFKKEEFNKDSFVEQVTPLGEIDSATMGDAIYKVRSLFEIASRFNPLFAMYCPQGDYVLYEDCFESLTNGVTTYYVSDYNPEQLQSKNSKKSPRIAKKKEEKVPQNKEKSAKEKKKLNNPFKVLKEDKFHYLFALVASFLIGFTIAIAVYDMYLGKKIFYFFLVCALVGAVLNTLIYKDTFKEHKFVSTEMILNVATSLVGIGLSVGGYFLFDYLAKDKANPNMLYIILIPIAVIAITVGIGYLISFLIKKKRA